MLIVVDDVAGERVGTRAVTARTRNSLGYGAPSETECELLLRAAHYWGHRGNQDAKALLHSFEEQRPASHVDDRARSAAENYVRALNYRLLALRLFKAGTYTKYVQSHGSPFLVPWLSDLPPVELDAE